ncbi:MAG: double zinc ribbon domain-containing protein, partial [Burkholderiaceae bacterium]
MPPDLFRRLPLLLARLPLLPTACALCGAGGEPLCAGCRAQFFTAAPPRCRQCAIALSELTSTPDALCGQCLKSPPAFDATIVAADYAPPLDQLVLALKFGHRLALAPLLARLLHQALPTGVDLPRLLLPVPLAPRRLALRGFN